MSIKVGKNSTGLVCGFLVFLMRLLVDSVATRGQKITVHPVTPQKTFSFYGHLSHSLQNIINYLT